jgi:hypothetical protein
VQELIKLHGGTLEIESVTAAESKDGSRTSHPIFWSTADSQMDPSSDVEYRKPLSCLAGPY